MAMTVVRACPTPAIIEEIRQEGVDLGADYTEFPEVDASSLCPATSVGAMWGWSGATIVGSSFGKMEGQWRVIGGVTVGLHYKVRR